MDLLEKLLVYDHEQRLTCKEALAHRYFDPVRFKLKQDALGTEVAKN